MPSALRLTHVSKYFPSPGGPRAAVRDVSFDVPAGGLVCLLGPNGSGKTTLLKSIATLLTPEEGTITLGGLDVHRRTVEAKRRIGFASTEDQSFYGRLTARMNLWFYGQLYGLSRSRFDERLEDLARTLDLRGALDKPFRELSSGMKQRLLLARADLHDPAVLILDEPHQNLDPRFSARLRTVLRDEWNLRRKKTLIISTHHLEDALKISDRWVVLASGRVRFAGSVGQERDRDSDFNVERFFERLTETDDAETSLR